MRTSTQRPLLVTREPRDLTIVRKSSFESGRSLIRKYVSKIISSFQLDWYQLYNDNWQRKRNYDLYWIKTTCFSLIQIVKFLVKNSWFASENYNKDLQKQGDLRNSLVLLGVTPLWHVAQWVSCAPPPSCFSKSKRYKQSSKDQRLGPKYPEKVFDIRGNQRLFFLDVQAFNVLRSFDDFTK